MLDECQIQAIEDFEEEILISKIVRRENERYRRN